jgi:hypothetical protein
MAALYADEQFPRRVTDRLRRLGHDVRTVQQTNQSKFGDARTDEEVLSWAMSEQRAVLTLNRKDFLKLHGECPWHYGMIICTVIPGDDGKTLAKKIDESIKDHLREHGTLKGSLLRVTQP